MPGLACDFACGAGASVESVDFSDRELTNPQGVVLISVVFDPLKTGGSSGP